MRKNVKLITIGKGNNMEQNITKIDWKKAWEMVKSGKTVKQEEIRFTEELLPWYVVQDLNDVGLRVPKNLVDYQDDKIDYSDIPPIEQLLEKGSYKEVFAVKFDNDIANWLRESKINYNVLLNDFLKTVYQSIKKVNQH
jgi:hypothetical protein